MKAFRWAVVVGGVAGLLTGCGDKTAVSKDNFKQVLSEDYASTSDCLFGKALPFPFEVGANDKLLGETRHKLDALAAAGLLTRERNGMMNRYVMTASGQATPGAGRFCYGKREVVSVDGFSQPWEFHGQRFTKVNYRFVEKQSPSWAKAAEVRSAFPVVAKAMAEQPADEATLVLTPDGWVRNE